MSSLKDQMEIAPTLPLVQSRNYETILFFITSIGSTLAWTAVLSNLVFYTKHLGESSFIYLNLAVYIPLIPISLAQARWDSTFDQKYESLTSFNFRGTFSYLVSIGAIWLIPAASNNLPVLSFLTLILGTTSAVLQGAMRQMASFVYPGSGILQASVSSGIQASAVAVLAVALWTGFGNDGSSKGLLSFNYSILGITICCWITFYMLMTRSNDVMTSMQRRDMSMRLQIEHESLRLEKENLIEDQKDIGALFVDLDYYTIWKRSWMHCVSLTVTLISSMFVCSYFNRVPSADPNDIAFPQLLFYSKMIPDLFGRPATIYLKPKSQILVLVFSIVRCLCVPVFLLYCYTDIIPRNNIGLAITIMIFSFFSGYIVTAVHQQAPDALNAEEKGNVLKQANLLNICFSVSILIGLLLGLLMEFLDRDL